MQESSDEQCVLGDEIVHEGIYSLSPMRPPMDEPMVYEAGAPFEDWEKTAPFVDDEQWDYSFSWPLTEIDISSSYGWRRHPISRRRIFHRGLDIRGQRGHPVMAVAPGMVTFAGWGGRASGRTVAIEHPGGYRSVYCHMFDVNVEPGSFVHKGAVIGLVGSTGRSTGNHLHLEIHKDGRPLNPVRSIGQTVSNRPSPP